MVPIQNRYRSRIAVRYAGRTSLTGYYRISGLTAVLFSEKPENSVEKATLGCRAATEPFMLSHTSSLRLRLGTIRRRPHRRFPRRFGRVFARAYVAHFLLASQAV